MSTNMSKRRKAAAIIILLITHTNTSVVIDKPTSKRNRSVWVREWLQKRSSDGCQQKIMEEFRTVADQQFLFKNFLRMDDETFTELVRLVTPMIQKETTNMRDSIPPSERLAVTLRFLATGDSFKSLSVLFRIAANTISIIIPEVCDALYACLKDQYMKVSVSGCVCSFIQFHSLVISDI